jgi:hypothetical protein
MVSAEPALNTVAVLGEVTVGGGGNDVSTNQVKVSPVEVFKA